MSERILIVEDDPTLRRLLRDNLIFEGYRVDAVSDGKAAIAYVRSSANPPSMRTRPRAGRRPTS